MQYLIDTHAHLDGEEFNNDISEVIDRAQASGIHKILIPNVNSATTSQVKELCRKFPQTLHPMIGLHPEDVKTDYTRVLEKMEEELQQTNDFIAIGEIGLDYYWDTTYKEEQIAAFKQQIEWGNIYIKPLMIHTRSAHADMISIMKEAADSGILNHGGVFHCFAGTTEEANEFLNFNGFMLGIGGIVTFKKSTLPTVLKESVPLTRIVLETDSPYMAPAPNRGKRNESANIAFIAQKIADIYECSLEDVIQQTTQNAMTVFGEKIVI